MKQYPIMYKLNSDKKTINQWTIVVDGDLFYTIEGQRGGVLTTSKPTVCKAKNVGRANVTTPEEQAISEAESKIQKKKDKGYCENVKNVATAKTYFDCMLAYKYSDYKDKLTFPVLCSRKIDGLRYIATKNGGITRNGKKYVSVPHIEAFLAPVFAKHPEWIIDGEIYSEDVPFEEIVSLVKKQDPTAQELKESAEKCKLYIFDGVTDDVNATFETRFDEIKDAIMRLTNMTCFKFVENDIAQNHDEIIALHDKYVAEGWEGVMIRKFGSAYENKRSKNLLKHKNFIDDEFVITDVIEGIGSRAGMAGKIVIHLKNPKTDGTYDCEAGLKGGEKLYIRAWKNRKSLIGKKATVRYQGLTNKNSLRFPVARDLDRWDI